MCLKVMSKLIFIFIIVIMFGCSLNINNLESDNSSENAIPEYTRKYPAAYALYEIKYNEHIDELNFLKEQGKNSTDENERTEIVKEINEIHQSIRTEVANVFGDDWNVLIRNDSDNALSKTYVGDQSFGDPSWDTQFQCDSMFVGWTPDSYLNSIYMAIVWGRENINGEVRNTVYTFAIREYEGFDYDWDWEYGTGYNPFNVENGHGIRYNNVQITLVLADDTNTNIVIGERSERPIAGIYTTYNTWTSQLRGNPIIEQTIDNITYNGSVFEAYSEVSILDTISNSLYHIEYADYPSSSTSIPVDDPYEQYEDLDDLVWDKTPASGFQDIAVLSDGSAIWAVGNNGTIWYSNTQGNTWVKTPASGFRRIDISSENYVFVVGIDGSVWYSVNSGVSWVKTNASGMIDVSVCPDGNVFVVGNDHSIWRTTTNNPFSWTKTNASGFRSVSSNFSHIIACGWDGSIWYAPMTSGTLNWKKSTASGFIQVSINDDGKIIATGYNKTVWVSYDLCQTWYKTSASGMISSDLSKNYISSVGQDGSIWVGRY